LRETLVERFADNQIEHRITEEFHPLVALEAVVGDRSMGERFGQQIRALKYVSKDALGALAEIATVHADATFFKQDVHGTELSGART
jgi:hypothetical protein